ncbi:MAG: hypothetical protein PVSMB7_28080 [Chloroflexota bacterium]
MVNRDEQRGSLRYFDVPSMDAELALLLVLGVTFYAAPWPVVYVLAAALLTALAWRRLDAALLLVPAFAPAFMQPKHIGAREFPPSELFLGICIVVAIAWLVGGARGSRFRWDVSRRSPFLPPALLLLAAATVSTLAAADHAEAFRAYRLVIIEPIAWVVLMLALGNRELWYRAFAVTALSGTTVALIAVGQIASGRELSTTGSNILRAKALYGSPDNLGLLFDRTIPFVAAAALAQSPFGRWISHGKHDVLNGSRRTVAFTAWTAASLVMLVGVTVSFSRGAWVAVAAGIALVCLLRGWWKIVLVVVLVGSIGAGIVGGPRVVHAIASGHANSAQQRVWLWQSSISMIRDHPIVGIGPDNFLHYFAPTRAVNRWQQGCSPGLGYIQPAAGAEPCLSHPHDVLLDFWLSTGILGLLAFLWTSAVFWLKSWESLVHSTGFQRALLIGTMGSMLAASVHGLVDNSYFLEDLSLLFWLLCGFVAFCVHFAGQDNKVHAPRDESSRNANSAVSA